MIRYKADGYGRQFVQISPWYPSSKKCIFCGNINTDLGRGEREWICPHCRRLIQRDLNAALNILDEGLRTVGSPVYSLVHFSHKNSPDYYETLRLGLA